MTDHSIRKCKLVDGQKTPVTVHDLSSDELSYIFIFVAKSGALDIARLTTVCRLFSDVCKREDVLMAVNFKGVEISKGNYREYQNVNGLVGLAAETGHLVAQCMFAKIIMLTCCQLIPRDPCRKAYFGREMRNRDEDDKRDQIFMSQIDSKSSCYSKGFYQYRFIRVFLRQCCPREFTSMYYPLTSYKVYCQKDSNESQSSLSKMCAVCKQLHEYENLSIWKWGSNFEGPDAYEWEIIYAYAYQFKTKHLRPEYEGLRMQALHDLDEIFIVGQ